MTKMTPAQKVFKQIVVNPGMSRIDYAKAARLETPIVGRAFQTLKRDGLITMKGDRRGATYTVSRNKAAQTAIEELGLTVTRRTVTAKPKAEKPAPAPEATKAPVKRSHKKKVVETPAPVAETPVEAPVATEK